MKNIADILTFLEESKFKLSNSNVHPHWKKKIAEQMTMYIPFISTITVLETSVEPVAQHKFQSEKK